MSDESVLSFLTSQDVSLVIHGGAITGGKKRRSRKGSKKSHSRRSRARKGSKKSHSRKRHSRRRRRSSRKGDVKKSAPINIEGKFTAYDVAKKKKVDIENPKLIKVSSSRGDRAMITGTSPLSGNKVVTFVSTADSRVSKHF